VYGGGIMNECAVYERVAELQLTYIGETRWDDVPLYIDSCGRIYGGDRVNCGTMYKYGTDCIVGLNCLLEDRVEEIVTF
jgi:hypothetical protein